MGKACKNTMTLAKPSKYLHPVFMHFNFSKISLFLFSSHDILKTQVFRTNAIQLMIHPLWKIISHVRFENNLLPIWQ